MSTNINYRKEENDMRSAKKEIEDILNNAEQILINQPELADMSLEDVINALNSTKQLISVRWGVAALLVIKSIKKWDLPDLIEELSMIKSGIPTYEYVGYLLQSRYGVDMEALLIQADIQDKFNDIVKYVKSNLCFLTEIKQEYITSFLHVLEKHIDSRDYDSVIINYAKSVASCNEFSTITTTLGELKSVVEYDLIHYIARDWFSVDSIEANTAMFRFLEHDSIWSKKSAVDYLGHSIYLDKVEFEECFSKIENIISSCNDLWLQTISVFIKYVTLYPKGIVGENHYYDRAMYYLRRIPSDSTKAKCNFLEAMQYEEENTLDIQEVFQEIILNPFEPNKCPLRTLDYILHRKVSNGMFNETIKWMLDIFRNNGYRKTYVDFFNGLSLVVVELFKNQEKVLRVVFECMLSNNIDELFFGLGLLMKSGNLIRYKGIQDLYFSSDQLIRILKAILYYSFDSSKTCNIAFQLLSFIDEKPDKYLNFCMEDVYRNYPGTLLETSKRFMESEVALQVQLSELVKKAYEKMKKEHELCSKNKDLQPYWEHQYIYRRAVQEQNKQISKKANEQSVFASLFSRRILKYGVRNAHIIKGANGEKYYQSSPYQYIKHEMELPELYLDDPVGFAMKKQAFLDEVISSALNN